MGFSGGIQTPNSPTFKLDMDNFKEALHKQWPDIQIKNVGDFKEDIDFGMTIKGQFYKVVGSTIQQHQIGWWSTLEELAEFAIWYRKYVPAQYQLLASCNDFYNYVVVTHDTTEQEILDGLLGHRYYFEILLPSQDFLLNREMMSKFKVDWPRAIILDTEQNQEYMSWFLNSQEGYIKADEAVIHFNDNNFVFASQIILWWRTTLNTDLKLVGKAFEGHEIPRIEFRVNITPQTSQQELLTRFKEGFQLGEV